MRRILISITALALVAVACRDSGATDTTDAATTTTAAVTTTTSATTTTEGTTTSEATTTTAASTTTAAATARGVVITSVHFDLGTQQGAVFITNDSEVAVSLAGHWLCQRPRYFELPDVTLEPGEVFVVATGDLDEVPGVGKGVSDGGALGDFDRADGEIGFYSSSSFGSSDAILSYVEWGSGGHGRSSTAVQAGIWNDGDFVIVAEESVGIRVDLAQAPGSAAWENMFA